MSSSDHKNPKFESAVIKAQLERILNSHKFLVADQLSRFLRYVVEETLAGRQDQIKQYTIAVRALGREPDFDPQIDPVVRMQAGQLRRALLRYYETNGTDDPIRIEIPKGRYVPVFLPNGPQPQYPETTPEPAPATSVPTDPQPKSSLPSIAVVPFIYLGKDEDDAYFATGLTEEIVIALTRFPEFLVVGPLHRDKIEKQQLGPRGIGQEYEVRFVLDGTVRRRGQTLRVTAKLTDAVSAQHLWGEPLDFSLDTTSIIELENEIVGQVAAIIADNFGIIPRTLGKEAIGRQPDRLSDYEAVLRFYHYAAVLTPKAHVEAMTALERAVQNDPDFAMAAALLGDLLASTYHLGLEDSPSILEQAETLGRKAVALDANCQPARFTVALLYFLKFQRDLCLEEIEKGLRLNPNHANYVSASALLLAMMGQWERGLKQMQKAMRLNPHHPGWYHLVPFMNCYRQGSYDSAFNETQRFNTPDFFWDPLIWAAVLGQLGRQPEAHKATAELLALVPDFASRGRSLIQRMVFLDEHVDMLLEGLGKAGLEITE